jgi:hypothetical protein
MLSDCLAEVVAERKAGAGHKKHYIPFEVEEFNRLRVAFKRPALTPNDVKLVLLAMANGKLDLVSIKPKAA